MHTASIATTIGRLCGGTRDTSFEMAASIRLTWALHARLSRRAGPEVCQVNAPASLSAALR